jgi:redox-sensitive bicupin YhaK (pirin superfamily)
MEPAADARFSGKARDARHVNPSRVRSATPRATEEETLERWNLRDLDVQAHHPEVLQSDGEGRTIVIQLPAGESLQEHQVHERAWLLVVDGEVQIAEDSEEAATSGPGTLAVFDPRERREVRATTDTRLLLLLAPGPGVGHPSQGVADQ